MEGPPKNTYTKLCVLVCVSTHLHACLHSSFRVTYTLCCDSLWSESHCPTTQNSFHHSTPILSESERNDAMSAPCHLRPWLHVVFAFRLKSLKDTHTLAHKRVIKKSSACSVMISACMHTKGCWHHRCAHTNLFARTGFISHSPTHAHRNPFLILKYTHIHTHMLSPTGTVE